MTTLKTSKRLTPAQRAVLAFISKSEPYDFRDSCPCIYSPTPTGDRRMKRGAIARVIGSLRSLGLLRLYNPDRSQPSVYAIMFSWGGSGGYRFCKLTPAGRAALATGAV